ncbi:hypothetical protein B9Z55_003606 [Caenorhabditis nigoni]|uniref:Uncharacterized protein n=1 Tax=Caenorhabditis nigoni TaxID=1611254 RepID=A0A2G5VR50_9PELO|nr:hypothetical protein B9Z55_003606 [Caenorhabditis nigoni]
MRFLITISIFLGITVVTTVSAGKLKTTTELSNLQIQVNSPNGAGFVHSALPIQARALGTRLRGGASKPTIGDDVLIPFDDPDFE